MQFVIIAYDGKDKQEARMSVREQHLKNLRKINGRLLCAGGILNGEGKLAGSTLILDFENREQLDEYLKSEPYVQAGVWEDIRIERMNVVFLDGEDYQR